MITARMVTPARQRPTMAQVTSYAMSDMFYLPQGTIPPMVMPFDPILQSLM